MNNSLWLSLLLSYIIVSSINGIRTIPKGYLLGATYELGPTSDKIYKIDPLTGQFTVFTLLDDYKPDDVTYDLIQKIFYVSVSGSTVKRESSIPLILVNPFNGTKQYRTIITEQYVELFGLRVDSSTGKLYSVQLSSIGGPPVSIVQIDPINFIAKRWVNITKVDGVSPDSMTIFYNSTYHQCFTTVACNTDHILVGIDLIKQTVISRLSYYNLPSYLCYDNKTNAFYGMQSSIDKVGCRLIRLNPYNGTIHALSDYFDNYETSAGNCYEGYYFTMLVLNSTIHKILTFDLYDNGKLISNKLGKEYLCSLAFIPSQ